MIVYLIINARKLKWSNGLALVGVVRDSGPKNVLTKNFLDRRGLRADDPQMTRIVQLSPHFAFVEPVKFDKKMFIDSNGYRRPSRPLVSRKSTSKVFYYFCARSHVTKEAQIAHVQRSPHQERLIITMIIPLLFYRALLLTSLA